MMMILYVLVAVLFVVFLVGGGLVLPLLELLEDRRDRRSTPASREPVRTLVPARSAEPSEQPGQRREKIAA